MSFADHIAATDRAVQVHLGGVAVTYTPEVGGPVTLTGMFDDRYVLADNGHAGVEQIVPAVVVRLEDLPAHPTDDEPQLAILGDTYTVRGRETDGVLGGEIRLLLRLVGM